VEPYPNQEDQPEHGAGSRGGVIVVVVIGTIFLIVVVLHLTGGMALHRP
jgi:hypothetical protein